MRATRTEPWSPADGTLVDPWGCLRACDKGGSCLAVFTTKVNSSWVCWLIEGGVSLGTTAGSVKVAPTQINAYYWAWNSVPKAAPQVSHGVVRG